MNTNEYPTHRLVKSEDLNHHGTLYAGRSAEWFVESGFVAASSILNPKNIICLKIHGMQFRTPVKPGECICYTSKTVYAGKSSLAVYVKVARVSNLESIIVDGFITFVHVDEHTKACPHGIVIKPETEEEKLFYKRASELGR
ncbi:MAG TPA: acyl-CoA thioesterase [Bacteroidales bacterium]|nr:acyl-CoA thioesterase [Bacteroidales bacterium]